MEFRKVGSKYFLRVDKGQDIVQTLKEFCIQENIKLGTIQGIGATNNVTVGLYDPVEKKYYSDKLTDNFEIAPLLGNITTKDKEVYLHLHINLCDKNHHSFGGHVNECIISATFEAVIDTSEETIEREFSEEIGLNLLKF
ncbi:DNA-binding protein [Patescibacteria group bacterium]|nr:DNA-binding protein [Patescibacteria group bacterium]MCL5409838.1 DNA-binding protein [Patescibacteria group bacterium]